MLIDGGSRLPRPYTPPPEPEPKAPPYPPHPHASAAAADHAATASQPTAKSATGGASTAGTQHNETQPYIPLVQYEQPGQQEQEHAAPPWSMLAKLNEVVAHPKTARGDASDVLLGIHPSVQDAVDRGIAAYAAKANTGTPPSSGDPAIDAALKAAVPDLKQYPPEKIKSITENAQKLRDGDFQEKIAAAAALAKDLQPDALPKLVKELGIQDKTIVKLATDKAALGAVSKLADPNASATDKVAAALTLANSLGGLAPKEVKATLDKYLAPLPAGAKLAEAIGKYMDPNASALDKAKATLEVATAAKESLGTAFPELAQKLRATESFTRSVSAAFTLLDPNASAKDKAQAALDLAVNLPDLKSDAGKLAEFLRGAGVQNAQDIAQSATRLQAINQLPDALKNSLDPKVAESLTPEQIQKLSTLAGDAELKDALPAALKQLKDPKSVDALLSAMEGAGDRAGQKALLATLSGLKEGVADELLKTTVDGKPAGEVLAKLTKDLSPAARENLTKLLKDFDKGSLDIFLKVADKAGGALDEVLKVADKIGIDSKKISGILKAIDGLLGKAGIEITGEIAEKIAKGLGKFIPLVGAVPAAASAIDLAETALNPKLPADIRFLALQGAKLNGADAALSVVEAFTAEFGVPVAADVALGVAELGIDLVVTDQIAKYNADPAGYKAPDWLGVANVAIAVSQGPQGVTDLVAVYGANGAVDKLGQVARLGGKAAIEATVALQQLQAQGVGEAAHVLAQGLHGLADIIRNPGKYGEQAEALAKQAVEQLSQLAQGAGDLAAAAAKELGGLVTDLKNLGEKGVQALGWIASHPGEAAGKAAQALGNLAQEGIKLGTEAGKALADAALGALDGAQTALKALGNVATDAYKATERAVQGAVDSAVALGEKGVETLGWIANHPGQAAGIAKDALVNIASQGAEYAQQAYDALVGLGSDGVKLAEQVANNLVNAGEQGVEMLKYVAAHPGDAASKAAQIAVDGLGTLARGVGRAAEAATDALVGLVDNGLQEAKDTVTSLLTEGGSAAKRIASAWAGELSEGAKEVIGGLKDLGDAGADALGDLANAGVDFAGDVLSSIGRGIKTAWDWATPW